MADIDGRHEAKMPLEGEVVEVATDNATEADPNVAGFITPKARTIIYITSLALTVLTGLVLGIGTIMGWMTETQSAQIGTLVFGAVATVNSALATGFRPTRPAVTTLVKK